MGPPSDNGGYAGLDGAAKHAQAWLQWVHRLITVVMPSPPPSPRAGVAVLQWVHRLITVVMDSCAEKHKQKQRELQWVHRLITVVMVEVARSRGSRAGASMGPPSDNGGYAFLVVSVAHMTPSFNGSTV